ncbi:type I-E CRISPR-associated protein Cas6/Cse3/CasE [Streptomyces sp. ISL-11]|uniref:type I-E CRISPR-associated protein Cas6/Cse3/CasE n=1 Tax=Streptomyces sp. ISL-11 TaxID=2819174 RepID=UPI001BED0399|nr:type I-E CRISPR-associated protein Cas6/Cse3/CasE [Streptomyces sp. ISL-11]MBT2384512.1 type I-E CRISPR-associated protein Cas6/Cse3/CasE [Streptomyces sp. ISL-11]
MTLDTAPITARLIAHHALCDLDLTHPLIARALLDCHDMHRLVMRAFRHWVPDGAPNARQQMGILHTYTADLATNTLTLLAQSRVPGDWTTLPATTFTNPPSTCTIDQKITHGQQYRFRTVITPSRYGPHPRTGAYTRERPTDASPTAALEWFTARLQPPDHALDNRFPHIGAHADPSILTARTLPQLTSHAPHRRLRVSRAEITGTLTVTEPSSFTHALNNGLGRARAYGCGLLLTQTLKEE